MHPFTKAPAPLVPERVRPNVSSPLPDKYFRLCSNLVSSLSTIHYPGGWVGGGGLGTGTVDGGGGRGRGMAISKVNVKPDREEFPIH